MKTCNRLLENTLAALSVALSAVVFAADGSENGNSSGARLWADNCARCHNMRDPQEFRDDQWHVIVNHMRVRGGLTGEDARQILEFLQATNRPAAARDRGPPSDSAIPAQAAATSQADEGHAGNAAMIYRQTCAACHGANGKGVLPGVADFTATDGPLAKSDEELFESIWNGMQRSGQALAMPPKGGDPSLTEADARALVKYLREHFSNERAAD